MIVTPYPTIVSLINNIRPDQPFQFYTLPYHLKVIKTLLLIVLVFFCSLIYCIKKKKIIINKIQNIIVEFKRLQINLLQSIRNFIKTEDTFHIILLAIMLSIGLLIRVFYINRPVFHDEAKTFYSFISSSWIDAISNYYVPNNHVFHSICARIFYLLFGNEEWVFRMPVFLSGIFTSAFIYIFARIYYNKHIALILSAVNTNAIPLVSYSVNARGYMMGTLFFLFLLILIKLLREKESVILWFLFIMIATLSVWTVPTMIMALIFLFTWYILNSNKSQLSTDLIRLLLVGLVCIITFFIVYSPVILRSTIYSLISNEYVQSQTLTEIVQKIPNYVNQLGIFFSSGYSGIIHLLLVLILFILGMYYHLMNKDYKKIIYSIILLLFVVLFILRTLPYARTFLFIYPLIWGIIVSGIYMMTSFISNYLKININKSVFFVSIVLFMYSSVNCIIHEGIIKDSIDQTCPQAEEIITQIKRELGPNDIIETSSPLAGPIRYYLIKSGINQTQFYWHSNNKSKNLLSEPNNIYVITRDKSNSLESFGYTAEESIGRYTPPKLWKRYMDGVNVFVITKSL